MERSAAVWLWALERLVVEVHDFLAHANRPQLRQQLSAEIGLGAWIIAHEALSKEIVV